MVRLKEHGEAKFRLGGGSSLRCLIWKATLLKSLPPGVTTSTVPVVAPTGTMVVISVAEMMRNVAAVPLKLTPLVMGTGFDLTDSYSVLFAALLILTLVAPVLMTRPGPYR